MIYSFTIYRKKMKNIITIGDLLIFNDVKNDTILIEDDVYIYNLKYYKDCFMFYLKHENNIISEYVKKLRSDNNIETEDFIREIKNMLFNNC